MPYHWLDFTPPRPPQIAAAPVKDFVTAAHTPVLRPGAEVSGLDETHARAYPNGKSAPGSLTVREAFDNYLPKLTAKNHRDVTPPIGAQ